VVADMSDWRLVVLGILGCIAVILMAWGAGVRVTFTSEAMRIIAIVLAIVVVLSGVLAELLDRVG